MREQRFHTRRIWDTGWLTADRLQNLRLVGGTVIDALLTHAEKKDKDGKEFGIPSYVPPNILISDKMELL